MHRTLPARIRASIVRIVRVVRPAPMDARAREEFDTHVSMETEANIRRGMTEADAKRAAVLSFGGRDNWTEAARDTWRNGVADSLARDVRYAFRTLRRAPGFAIATTLTLALGIGANTAVFSAVDAALFKPLPFADEDRIVSLYQHDRKQGVVRGDVAPANFADWRERASVFSGMAVAEPYSLVVAGPDGRERVGNWYVTEDFFSVLRVTPVLGRLFDKSDYAQGPARVVVLTYGSWQRRFGGDPNIVGRTINVVSAPMTVVGVLPRAFAYLTNETRYEMFAPKVLDSTERTLRSQGWYHAVALMKPGITITQASADLDRVANDLSREYPVTNADKGISVTSLRDGIAGNSANILLLLLGAVLLVLLIACVNVANLMLARTARRGHELTIRAALGAGRRRLAQQMFTESFALALCGGIAGVALAYWGVGVIRQLSPVTMPRLDEVRVDGRALLFTLGSVVFTTIACGLIPALRSRGVATTAAPTARVAGGRREHALRGLFMATEIGLAVVLLVGAGLLVRSLTSVLRVDRGYESANVMSAAVFVWQYQPDERAAFVERVVARAATLPGVTAAGAATSLPLADAIGADKGAFRIEGQPNEPGQLPSAHITALTPGTFDALQIRLLRGRVFASGDDAAGAPVAVINESMARRYWPNTDPIGRPLIIGFYGAPAPRTVVGIVADVRQSGLEAAPEPLVFLPHAQTQAGAVSIVLRTTGAPRAALPGLRKVVAEFDPKLPLTYVATLDEVLADTLKPRRFTLMLLGCFSVLALVLAVIGVYGVISNGTAERAREIGVRMALGARRGDIIRMVLVQGMTSAVGGVAAGLIGAMLLSRLLSGMLFSVAPVDPLTYAGVITIVLGAAVVACYIPARRATGVDPVSALRAG